MSDTPTETAPVPQRVVIDLTYTPNGEDIFLPDLFIEAVQQAGEVDNVTTMWAGPENHPVGNIPWPRLPSSVEQAVNDQAMAELRAAEEVPEPTDTAEAATPRGDDPDAAPE